MSADHLQADFAAKVRWRMFHDRNPLFPTLQDKAAVKRYAHERGVASPELLYLTDDPATLPFDHLPDSYFIKANHGTGWNILCEHGQLYYFEYGDKILGPNGKLMEEAARYRFSREQIIDICRYMLGLRFSENEWAYHHIPPRILVEEKLHPADSSELLDYRFYTFDGVVRAISVGSASYRKNRMNVFLNLDWEAIPLTIYREQLPDPLPGRPRQLEEMIAAAQRLGAGLDFARIDLYQTTRGIMLGEMTLYPEAGKPDAPTACTRFNHWLGAAWQHPGHAAGPWD